MIQVDKNNEVLNKHLSTLLNKDLYLEKFVNACPHCTSNNFIKHGSYQNKQRFLCKQCRKTFTNRTNTTFYRTKKSAVLWVKFLNLMISKKSLRYTSHKLNISLGTTFYWRHKILHSLIELKGSTELRNLVDMIKIFIKENYKGDRNAPLTERKNVWTILSHDENDYTLASPISIGKWDRKSFDRIIYSKISNESYLSTYCDRYLHKIAEIHNKDIPKNIRSIYDTNLWKYVNEFKNSLRKFNGVATKYLRHYLYFASAISVSKKYTSTLLIYKLSSLNIYIMNKDLKKMKVLSY